MNVRTFLVVGVLACLGLSGCGPEKSSKRTEKAMVAEAVKPRGPVEIGDSLTRVKKTLGDVRVEFPDGDHMIHWFSGYQVTTSNKVVVAVDELQAGS